MTAPTGTLPDLDEATKQQLQPPCEMVTLYTSTTVHCSDPAEWIVRWRCTACSLTGTALYCGPHRFALHGSPYAWCDECPAYGCIRIDYAEPIRGAA